MRPILRLVAIPAAIALGLAPAGCGGGDGLPRQPVSGKVTLDGGPLEGGVIQFEPESSGEFATAVGAIIQDGAYTIPRDHGPTPGTYKVSIFSSGAEPATDEMPGGLPPPRKELVPPRYNTETTLTATVIQGERPTFDFALESE